MSETIIYKSNSFDPWYNLAAEELLLDTVSENQYILYLLFMVKSGHYCDWKKPETIKIKKW